MKTRLLSLERSGEDAVDMTLHVLRNTANKAYLALNLIFLSTALLVSWIGGQSVALTFFLTVAASLVTLLAVVCFKTTEPARVLVSTALAVQVMTLIFAASKLSPAFVEEAHMSYFIVNAVLIAYMCLRSIFVYNVLVVLHHVILTFIFPELVWTRDASGEGVSHLMIHAGIAAILIIPLTLTVLQIRAKIVSNARALDQAAQATARAESEAAAAREANEGNRTKSQFLANMSHEIRTPLNGVLGLAYALSISDLSPTQREQVKTIRNSGQHLLALLNSALDLAKIEAGKVELELIEFDLVELMQTASALFSATAAAKGLSLDIDVSADASLIYRGDPTRLSQVVHNLLGNAVKFTDAGSVTARARLVGEQVVIDVEDTGAGISAEAMARLFGKFSQADASTTRKFGGTGLGLALAKQLCEMMGGTLTVQSVVGEGSVFTVSLPLQRVGEAKRRSPPAPMEDGPDPWPNAALRVLAAEDHHVNQMVLKAMLDQFDGIDLHIVDDGAAAVQAWEGGAWDIVLMDVQMPIMDGLTATRKIRALEGARGFQSTPILALSANAMTHDVAEYAEIGMDGFVAKPIELDKLLGAIEAVLAARQEAGVASEDIGQADELRAAQA